MQKQTNPFYTINEAIAVLKSLGAKPESNPFVYDESCVPWTDETISIKVSRVYNAEKPSDFHFEMEIHTDLVGLDKLVALTGLTIMKEHHSEGFDQFIVRPGSLLKVFAIKAKDTEESK